MKLLNAVALLAFINVTCYAQKVDQFIKEKEVTRIIKTLSADDMTGRPANMPELIEKATAFIEKEFKKIGLKPLKGLTNFRQGFKKDQISPVSLEVIID